ncbi:cytochrome d ubiquinol oxidase subunit II [Francisella adeliensis]|uniref:Cytochrome C oxidase subunit II n=1 Tax=Francisella adeliensis TaxID=2007306 RepID=A0A2Z4XWJ7_9GAMM|nr:cytochrome d ubiquinol oxidase subunit II [Francisella adeliensis]AXA33241.1 cytochrome C oxidase subunit II [Francisella adeliensis]MBK2085038.1 cytochrome d ubiquinol oxidase subunit II [Francisella adeliensis]MBK2096971.1 cytochrome d ubiquinol oxidase subunit II [Francisella adeliensis]QIW11467.1 cytochrome d ubiquinol oxidase subunit II [Francisella adeliensis]QIW13342.1 cytochrome d ubiquinol oxidase subunit II [Francisella adeliensis]
MDLGLIWLGIIAFGLLLYVILDGFALGVGILFPFFNSNQRDIATSVLLPTWDGNQTWLVLSLACFYGMFPIAFAFIFPKIYMSAVLLVVMLLFRGICFEFRLKASDEGIKNWDKLFFISSITATFLEGFIVGGLIVGYPKDSVTYGLIFQVLTGITLIAGYALLGATRLILKTEGALFEKAKLYARKSCRILAILMLVIGLMTPLYITLPLDNIYKMFILGEFFVLTIISFFILWKIIDSKIHALPYWLAVTVFILTYLSMLTLMFPYVIPYHLTYMEAQASQTTLLFTLIPAIIMIPLLLLYTGYAYFVFKGKVKEKLSY